jgi:hypothetical protein
MVQPLNKGEMMQQRLAARLPLVLFVIDLRTGELRTLLHSTDWINLLLFSPADPNLLMYCHEGPWQKVDRIWLIHTDGTHNTLIHKRTMFMEIAGHEFWSPDGKTIWYDWQTPKGEDFWLASYEVATGKRIAYHMQRNEWSIHFNVTSDGTLFCGDGGDPGQVARAPDGEWIYLFHPQLIVGDGVNDPSLIQGGVFHGEKLVNMSKHNYRLEPNVSFTPDKKWVIFRSNMFGPTYVFAGPAVLLALTVQFAAAQAPDPSLSGIAHVAIRVSSLDQPRAFFHKLGFDEAFAMDQGGSPTEAFFKVNDRQFIELYPRRDAAAAVGFMHVCFEAADINSVYQSYVAHGLSPTPVKRAGAGNLLFTLQGPDEPGPPAGLRPAVTKTSNIRGTCRDRVTPSTAGSISVPIASPMASLAWRFQ